VRLDYSSLSLTGVQWGGPWPSLGVNLLYGSAAAFRGNDWMRSRSRCLPSEIAKCVRTARTPLGFDSLLVARLALFISVWLTQK